ncbi:unnamed protein product, partial [Protopolystoma xenopodis]
MRDFETLSSCQKRDTKTTIRSPTQLPHTRQTDRQGKKLCQTSVKGARGQRLLARSARIGGGFSFDKVPSWRPKKAACSRVRGGQCKLLRKICLLETWTLHSHLPNSGRLNPLNRLFQTSSMRMENMRYPRIWRNPTSTNPSLGKGLWVQMQASDLETCRHWWCPSRNSSLLRHLVCADPELRGNRLSLRSRPRATATPRHAYTWPTSGGLGEPHEPGTSRSEAAATEAAEEAVKRSLEARAEA